jgi:predicted glycosyltransferase
VPDAKGTLNLAGELSHPIKLPKTPVTYLGLLSRFEIKETEAKYDVCIILSGPEPQRTIFEKIILKDLFNLQDKIILVRGLPGAAPFQKLPNSSVVIKNHLPSGELNEIIQQSKFVICRSGYSSVMDLAKLQKRALLVPTPAQTEQEYLARYLNAQKLFYCVDQSNFSLNEAIKKASSFKFNVSGLNTDDYKNAVEIFVGGLGINSAGI